MSENLKPVVGHEETVTSTLPFWRKLHWNLMLSFVLLAVLLVVSAVTITLTRVRTQAGEQVTSQLESIAELKRDQIVRWLDDSRSTLALLLADPARYDQLAAFAAATLQENVSTIGNEQTVLNKLFFGLVKTEPFFEELLLYNAGGHVVAASDPASIGKIVTRQPYFSNSLVDGYVQTPYYEVDARGGKLTMFVTQPLIDRQTGRTAGVLAGRLDLEFLGQIMSVRTGLGDSGETYLVSVQNNYLLTPSRFEGYPLTRAYRSEGIDRVLRGEDGFGLYQAYRDPLVSVFGVYRWIPELKAGLIAEVDEAEALLSFTQARNFSLVLVATAAVVAVALGLYNARRVSKPITALTETAIRITAGDLEQRARITRRNEIGLLALAFNTMTERLRILIDTLEDRVRDRTQALETAAEVSRQITTILDINELLRYLVNRIQTEFAFYHTHIYLVEATSGALIMAEGSGEVGQKLKARGHRLESGQGIVGTVAAAKEALLSNDVDKTPNFVRNPLLPDTRSELAVPLRKGGQVLGVLDIQSEQAGRFTAQDLSLMQSIADQAAVALDNARLLAQTQAALQQVEQLNRRLTRKGWDEFVEELATFGYRFKRKTGTVTPASEAWLPPMKQAAVQKQLVKHSYPDNGDDVKTELAVPLMLRGEVIGVLGVKRDETPEWSDEEVSAVEAVAGQVALALENARLSREQERTIVKLQDVDRLKSEFLTSMSHELRTPLNSILGFADVLLQGIDGELDDIVRHDVQLIFNSGQHLLALINDILDISKIEAGMLELLHEPLALKGIINDVLAATGSLLKEKPVAVVLDVAEDLPPVYADKLRLNQILLNLVSNAAKFTDEGKITISAKISENDPGQMFISVTDTGIGIPQEKYEAIFDRFNQVDNSTTRRFGGTGLGLPICRQLVQMHGGNIGVTSREGYGSTFYFTIPLVTDVVVTA